MESISYLDTPESWEQLLRYIWRVNHTWILQSHGNSYSETYGECIVPGYSRVMGTATQVNMESKSYLDTPKSWEQQLRYTQFPIPLCLQVKLGRIRILVFKKHNLSISILAAWKAYYKNGSNEL
jgi:hypothetical protein